MDLHENVAGLAALLGTWRGNGHGSYPTITDFDYTDEWVFSHSGKPFIGFVQRTKSPTGAPMHTESGYLRGLADGTVEIVAALPTGHTELGTGTVATDEHALVLTTRAEVVSTPAAKPVQQISRVFRVEGDVLTLELAMAAVGVPSTPHLTSRLVRVSS
ncbi:FABP family protein [Propionibacteriaceae bacterium Y1923]|uniref:FABP family protein n=1 Tax=Aestuariimicrobium sp. Y1814 TaxID=3418742 RepID=UPI003C199721